jgi:magnesium-transporting ATPase (P-type)
MIAERTPTTLLSPGEELLMDAEEKQSHDIYISDQPRNKVQREPWRPWGRDIFCGYITKRKYSSNVVSTTIYSWWNFFVLNIIIQYCTKLSNFYFTIVMIFSCLPGVSPVFPVTSIIPVVFIVGVNMLKDGFEDLVRIHTESANFVQRRWKSDRNINIQPSTLVADGEEKIIATSKVYAGDIIKIKEGETFPADLVLLSSSNKGVCHIETSNLDGYVDWNS